MKILGIPGSLRKGSYNRMALRAAEKLLPADARMATFELGDIPLYNQDRDADMPAPVLGFKQAIREADAILVATPEYNYSIPGPLKYAIDWASRTYGQSAWKGKPVALLGASVSPHGTSRAQHHLRQVFVTLDMPCVTQPEVLIADAAHKFGADGELSDETARKLIARLLERLLALAGATNR